MKMLLCSPAIIKFKAVQYAKEGICLLPYPAVSTMKDIRQLLEDLNKGGDLHTIRNDIADLVEHSLQRGKETGNMAALPYFINVIGSLTRNVNCSQRATSNELHTCLADLEDAIAALDGNAKPFRLRITGIDLFDYDYLLAALDVIRRAAVGRTRTLSE